MKRREFISLLGGAAAALAGAFYHSVLLQLPHAVGLARLRAGRMVPRQAGHWLTSLNF